MTEIGWLRTLIERKAFWQYPKDATSPHPKDGQGVHSDCLFLPERFAVQSDLCGVAGHDLCQAFNGANDEQLRKGILGQSAPIPFEVVVALDEPSYPVAWQIATQQAEYGGTDIDVALASSDDLRAKVSDRNVVICATYVDTDIECAIKSLRGKLADHDAQVMNTVFAVVRFKDPSAKDDAFPGRLHALLSMPRAQWRIHGACVLCRQGSTPLVYSEATHGNFFPGVVKQSPITVAPRVGSRCREVAFA